MAVYVDEAAWRLGRMHMCHMIADTPDELYAMVDRIGVQRRWVQFAGTWKEHFDVSKAKRMRAIRCGARAVDRRTLVQLLRARRACAAGHGPLRRIGCVNT